MTTRTHKKWWRVYADGVDVSGYTRDVGPLAASFEQIAGQTTLTDPLHGFLPGQPVVSIGTLNSILDNDAAGLQALAKNANAMRAVMVALGMGAAPVAGNPVFAAELEQMNYLADVNSEIALTLPFAPSARGQQGYPNPWGVLLLPKSTQTAANTGTADHDHGAATALGGFMCWELFSSDGTVTIKVQDADTNLDGSFSDLASSGSQDASVTPAGGIVMLSKSATVERYIRWQIALGTATTALLAVSFHRALFH